MSIASAGSGHERQTRFGLRLAFWRNLPLAP
jgi:hypothetical protein